MAGLKAISRFVLGRCRQEIQDSPRIKHLPYQLQDRLRIKHLPYQLISSRGIASQLYVGGLSYFTTEKVLVEAFSKFGKVTEAKIIMNRVTGRSKRYGFITFASEDEALNALTGMNGMELSGKVIFVDYAKAQQQPSDEVPVARGPPELPHSKE